MVVKNVSYLNPEGYLFLDQKRKLGMIKRIQKQIDKFGLTDNDVKFSTTWLFGDNIYVSQNNKTLRVHYY